MPHRSPMRVALLVLPLFFAAPAHAEKRADTTSIAPMIADLHIGFSGHYRLGFWTLATVTIDGGRERLTGRIECVVQDADGVPVTYTKGYNAPIVIEPTKRQSFTIMIKVGRAEAKFSVRLFDDEQILCEKTFYPTTANNADIRRGLSGTSRLMIVVGPPIGLSEALENGAIKESVATHVVPVIDTTHLPTTPTGYGGVDVVVLSAGKDNSPVTQLGPLQRGALLDWVMQGGRIMLIAGEDARVLLDTDGPLADFVPGHIDSMIPLRQATAIEAFCESRYPVKAPGGALNLHVPRVVDIRGKVLVFEGSRTTDLPLVVREPRGLGEITFIAFDLSVLPFSDWAGRSHLLRRLFTTLSEEDFEFVEASNSGLTSLGYNDLVGQLRASLDEFHGIQAVPFMLVAALAVLYIALIGPLDYLIVRRWLVRPSLTWVTLPAWVVLFTLLAWWLGREFKGEAVRANHVELVDIDNATGQVRGTIWTHLYSPRIDTFNLSIVPRLPDGSTPRSVRADVSWLGLPGDALGGMQTSGGDSPFAGGYRVSEDDGSLVEMPLSVASTKSLTAHWTGRVGHLMQANLLSEGDGHLEGSVENRSGWDLSDVRLLYGRRAWVLGELNNGDMIDLAKVHDPLSIRTVLILGTSGFSVPYREGAYDPTTLNAKSILDTMTWYEQVGGPGFVRLLNRHQAFCDMSDQLKMGRAILTGVANARGSQLHDADNPLGTTEDKQLVICRFVLTVGKEK